MLKIARSRRQRIVLATAAMAASAGLLRVAPAASITWDGGANEDANWSRPLNWDTNTVPAANDSLFFGGFTRLSTNNDLTAATAFNGLTFNSIAGAFTLAGNSITLNGDITDNTPLLTQNVNLALVLNADRTLAVTNQGLLSIGGVISGSFGLNKTGLGTATLSGANTFTGPINITGGLLSVSAANHLGGGAATGDLTINGATLRATGNFAIPGSRPILLGPAGGGGSGTIEVASGNNLTYSGKIANNAGGVGTLNKIKFGTLTLGSTNTYTGATNVRNGNLILNFADANAPVTNIINSASNLVLGGDTAGLGTTNNATLTANAKAATANIQSFASTNIDIYGSVITSTNSGTSGTMRINLGALTHTVGGTVVIPTNSGIVNTTTTVGTTNGILGGWAIAGTPNVQRVITMGTDFATVDGTGNIIPYTGYVTAPAYGTGNTWAADPGIAANADKNLKFVVPAANTEYKVDENGANSTLDINTLNFQTGGLNNSVLTIGTGNTLRFGQYGAIFKSTTGNQMIFIGGTGGGTFTAGPTANAGSITAGGPVTGTPGELVIGLNETANNSGGITIVSNIVDNGAGAVTLIKNSVASAKVDGHNTYSGGTYINQGRFQLAGSEQLRDSTDPTLSIGNPDGLGTGPVFVAPGSYLFISGVNGNGLYTGPGAISGAFARLSTDGALPASSAQNAPMYNDMFLSGNGTNQEAGGSIRFGNRSMLFGSITLAGDTRLFGGNAAAYPKIMPNGIDLYYDPGNEIVGNITGDFNLDFGGRAVAGLQMVLSNTGNDWGGQSTILATNGSTRIRLGANEVIPHGVGKGNLVMGENTGANTGIVDLQGYNETINGLSTAGGTAIAQSFIENNGFTATVTDQGTDPKIYSYAGVTSTLTLGGNDQTTSFGGIIRDNDPALSVTLPDPNGSTVSSAVIGPGVLANSKIALTKIGSGNQTLAGANSYSGQTTINGGTLTVTGTLNSTGTVVVNSGGTLAGTGTVGSVTVNAGGHVAAGTSIGTIGLANLTLNSADLAVEFGVGTADLINVAGSTTLTGAGTVTPGGIPSAGTYTILDSGSNITYGTSLTLTPFQILPDTRTASGTLDTTSELDKIKVIVTGGAKLLTWTGANGNVWDKGTGGTVNWQDPNPTPEKFFNADGVTFGSGPTNRSIALNMQVSPGSMVFTNDGSNPYYIGGTGQLAGLGGITMNGVGDATIATNNIFSGSITVNAGKLIIKGTNTNTGVTINGGILQIDDGGSVAGTIDNSSVLQLNSDAGYTFNNAIAQSGELRKTGTGLVTMNGNNTSNGSNTINAGTLTVTSFTNRLGSGSITVNAGGALDLVGIGTANVAGGFGLRQTTIFGTGPTGLGALTNTGLSQTAAYQNITLGDDATIGGTGRYDVRGGPATLDLATRTLTKIGTNQFSVVGGSITDGNVVVNAGTFSIETGTNAFLGTGTFTWNDGTTAQFFSNTGDVSKPVVYNGNVTVTTNNTVSTVNSDMQLNGVATMTVGPNTNAAVQFNLTGTLHGTGSIVKTAAGVLQLGTTLTTGNTFTGGTTISAGTVQVGGLNALPGDVTNNATLNVYNNNASGNIDGTGNMVVGDVVTTIPYTATAIHVRQGSLTINNAGSLVVINPNALAAGTSRVGNLTIAADAKLNITDNKLIVTAPNSVGSWDGTAYTATTGKIVSGRGTGNLWDGTTGITTSQTDAVGSNLTSIGISSGTEVLISRGLSATDTFVWSGQTISAGDTLVMYTYGGDANLDGKLNIDDYVAIDQGIASSLTGWSNGDYNYDGKVNIDDYSTVIDSNIGNQVLGTFATSGGIGGGGSGVSAVPEPAGLTILAAGAMGLLRRRRRMN